MTAISLSCWSESDQKAIREQLVRILNSGPFHQSQRRQRFLEYLVNETLAGRGERLKAYNVALEVFERPETFDPTVDPLVRIEAARLREKLLEYYGTDGQGDPIHIDLETQTVTTPFQDRFEFTIDPFRKHCLMNGVDEIGLTLASGDAISEHEKKIAAEQPWLVPAAA